MGQWTLEQHQEVLTLEDIAHLVLEDKQGNKVGYAILTGL